MPAVDSGGEHYFGRFLLLTSVMGFPNQFFNDSWVVGIWRAGHGGNNVGLGRRAWALARAVPRALGSQVTAANVSTLRGGADRTGGSQERSANGRASCAGGL